jgi:hypothetical protein
VIDTQINPEWMDTPAYVELLNRGFPGQWNRASIEWHLRRRFLGRPPDIALRSENRRVVAVASYSYRQITDPRGNCINVCVMAAGATLPAERRRGHYSALLQTGLELCRERSCAALLGFTTRANASARGLMRLGAHSIPSFYIVSGTRRLESRILRSPMPRLARLTDAAWKQRDRELRGHVRFHYVDQRDWLSQFIHRPNPVSAWRVSHDAIALVEAVGATDRLQWLGCPDRKAVASIAALASASASARRNFFMYTLDPALAASAKRLGLAVRHGFLMMLPADLGSGSLDELATASWRLQSGDRM